MSIGFTHLPRASGTQGPGEKNEIVVRVYNMGQAGGPRRGRIVCTREGAAGIVATSCRGYIR